MRLSVLAALQYMSDPEEVGSNVSKEMDLLARMVGSRQGYSFLLSCCFI